MKAKKCATRLFRRAAPTSGSNYPVRDAIGRVKGEWRCCLHFWPDDKPDEIVARWWYVRSDSHVANNWGDFCDIAQVNDDNSDPNAWKAYRGTLTTKADVAPMKRDLERTSYSKGRVRAVRVTAWRRSK